MRGGVGLGVDPDRTDGHIHDNHGRLWEVRTEDQPMRDSIVLDAAECLRDRPRHTYGGIYRHKNRISRMATLRIRDREDMPARRQASERKGGVTSLPNKGEWTIAHLHHDRGRSIHTGRRGGGHDGSLIQ